MILRIPGVGARSAKRIVAARRFASLNMEHLHKFGVVLKRAKYFLVCRGQNDGTVQRDFDEQTVRRQILFGAGSVRSALVTQQLDLFAQAS